MTSSARVVRLFDTSLASRSTTFTAMVVLEPKSGTLLVPHDLAKVLLSIGFIGAISSFTDRR